MRQNLALVLGLAGKYEEAQSVSRRRSAIAGCRNEHGLYPCASGSAYRLGDTDDMNLQKSVARRAGGGRNAVPDSSQDGNALKP